MEKFIDQIYKNLENNGFPKKKVTLPTEKMFEIADEKGLSLNNVFEKMKDLYSIDINIGNEKIIFTSLESLREQRPVDLDENMMAQAQEMLKNMNPEELRGIQDKVASMSDEEKEQMMEQAKAMGLL